MDGAHDTLGHYGAAEQFSLLGASELRTRQLIMDELLERYILIDTHSNIFFELWQ